MSTPKWPLAMLLLTGCASASTAPTVESLSAKPPKSKFAYEIVAPLYDAIAVGGDEGSVCITNSKGSVGCLAFVDGRAVCEVTP